VPITDVLLLGFKHAGLTVESYATLDAAKKGGAQVAIVGALTTAEVSVAKKDVLFLSIGEGAEAVAELSFVFVDLGVSRIVQSGLLKAVVRHDKASIRLRESEAASPAGEIQAHFLRTLLAQCYYHLSMDLAAQLQSVSLGMLR
jgi:hypothetical protein